MHSFFIRLWRSPVPRRAAIVLVALLALAWSSLAFCGEIHDAALEGDLAKVKALLNENPDLVLRKDDRYGMTPLHYAAAYGHKDVAELLLANKADVNAKDNQGWTPLHYAALKGYADVAELLLANKAEVNAEANSGWTPLHYAAANGHKDVAELLRQHGGQDLSTAVQSAPQPAQPPTPEAKPVRPPGPKIILLKPTMQFEDVRRDGVIPANAKMEREYETQLLSAAKEAIGTKLPVVELEKLDPAGMEECKRLEVLASRVARGNINEEAKEALSRLAALDEEQLVLVQFFRLKVGPGGSWNPNTGAIASAVQSTLMQAALVSCKNGRVVWKGEQFLRKAVGPTSPQFQKLLTLLYQDFNTK
jgi:hypothetical protein